MEAWRYSPEVRFSVPPSYLSAGAPKDGTAVGYKGDTPAPAATPPEIERIKANAPARSVGAPRLLALCLGAVVEPALM